MFGLLDGPSITAASYHLSSPLHLTNLVSTPASHMNAIWFPLGWLLKFGPLPVACSIHTLILLLLTFLHRLLSLPLLHAFFHPSILPVPFYLL